jgi:hypothetical protein
VTCNHRVLGAHSVQQTISAGTVHAGQDLSGNATGLSPRYVINRSDPR